MNLPVLTPTARVGAFVVAGVLIFVTICLVVYFLGSGARERGKAEVATTGRAVAEGRAESAQDATNAVADQAAKDATSEALTRNNADAIDKTEGARTSVGKPLDSAGRRALCLRVAYRDSAQCKQLLQTHP